MSLVDLCRGYRAKHGDEMPLRKLARIIYRENRLLFKDYEHARSTLRRAEGRAGEKDRLKGQEKPPQRPVNPYKLPGSDPDNYVPYILNAPARIAMVSDVHVPYHDIGALTAFLDYVLSTGGASLLLINGDFFDFYRLSRFINDPNRRGFAEEIEIGCQLITAMKAALGCPVVFKLGNHDERFEHFIWTKASELEGLDEFRLQEIIAKRVSDITVVGEKRIIKAGALNILHGHELPSGIGSPVNIARGLHLRTKGNAICGHHHRTSYHVEQTIDGRILSTWSTGCFSGLNPQYMPINSWNHGGAIIELHADGENFDVDNIKIHKGKVL